MKIHLYPPLSIHELGQRPNQEDSFFPAHATTDDKLFVLCDGMGGHEHGEVASQTVCEALGTWFQNYFTPPLSDARLGEALAYAYEQLDKKDGGEFKKMGTTLTLLYFDNSGVTALHMGDSRIYHIRPGVGILYQSRDHSIAFELYQSGEITYDEMVNYPKKNIISRAMTPGKDNRMRPDIIHISDVQPEDYFFSCSDGILEQMSNGELYSILSSKATNEEKRQQIIDATVNNQDNHTAWIIHVKDVVKEKGDELLKNEEPTARCNAFNIDGYEQSMDDVMMVDGGDIEMAEYGDGVKMVNQDDIVALSPPPYKKKKSSILLRAIALFACVLLIFLTWLFFFQSKDNIEIKNEIQKKIDKKVNINDSIDKDNNTVYESAENQ